MGDMISFREDFQVETSWKPAEVAMPLPLEEQPAWAFPWHTNVWPGTPLEAAAAAAARYSPK